MRSNLNGILLQNFQQMAPKVPEAKRPEFMQMVQSLILETTMDQASLTAHNLERTLDDLKGKEKELEAFHGKSKEEKEAACQMLLGMAMNTLDIAQLPQIDPEDAKLVPEKLGIVSKEIMGVLARFAAADSDPALKRLAPLFQAYQYLLDGKSAEAEASFRTVRDDGLKLLGDGDAAKGEQALKEKIAKATLALQANDPATAQQIIQGELPPGLADAYMFLKPMEDQRKRTLNLRAVGAWEEQIHSRYDEAKKNVSSIGKVWDGVWGNKNSVDKLSEKETAEINVVSAVRGRISTGKCSTIEEALKDIVATETDQEIKDGAAAALGLATAGLDSGMMPLSRLMKLSSGTTIDDSTAGTMMSLGKTMDNIHAFPKLRAFLFTAVQTNSTDMSKRAEAEIGLKKALEE